VEHGERVAGQAADVQEAGCVCGQPEQCMRVCACVCVCVGERERKRKREREREKDEDAQISICVSIASSLRRLSRGT